MPFKQFSWEKHGEQVKLLYCGELMSCQEVGKALGLNGGSIKNALKRNGLIRSMSEASKLAVEKGKKEKAIALLIKSAQTDNRFNPLKRHKGEEHPRWIKDRTKLKHRKHSSFEGRVWRKAIFERDGYTCLVCNKVGGRLQAHHIKPWAKYPELRSDLDNGVTLCIDCHKLQHRRK